MIRVIGGGLAGCEAAWQAASQGVPVTLYEMRPVRPTAVHKTDRLAELVCSNSFRGDKLDNAVGLLKEEMRRLGSLVMRAAEASRVPAGAALAVDRERFAETITTALNDHPLITIVREEMTAIPESSDRAPVIVATGPLTSDALSSDIAQLVGSDHLYFYDAISPIVLAETIDRSKVFRASRWNRSIRPVRLKPDATDTGGVRLPVGEPRGRQADQPACGVDDGEGDYLNCPLTREEYDRFYDALVTAESATVHDFDKERFFEGCLPIEVMAHRGRDTLRFGPMKPVGLTDPRTGREPYAAVQLRQDNLAGDHFSLVGFQTQIKWGDQARVLRLIPGLEQAEFVRFGMVHRNTYVNGPTVLAETWQVRVRPTVFFAGQMSGVEGYVESAASGLIAGLNAAALVKGEAPATPPRTTAIGALAYYVSHADPAHYEPSNITFGIMAPLPRAPRSKMARKLALSERALADLQTWLHARASQSVSEVSRA
ncbi:MAG: methylenetetrahydrofolate--tRNA-(uracil(54)-C(5))-methyltransferase (FADH(2)-oxidizing) TrmFO [Acidobacteria bacterium 13_1_40CM_2_64_6]|nr:MAG: methylenetetrahydrofolate--tRNA-(uracil(54)-C(5))-methyltransferase (FADH(2)-oxidizing) TrmFO [Acidobacteria bacterium 13_1_40CM_65_14]OLD55588.1 MAG: methylenetetrahydrofolate--tRNA-(uracil(54)-C(5))-methyltransferase (FADH(2)-oxidizing) TrmFO [Acidobacteria bacterium 13_1_40CM_2_64_6]OLE80274.1 MAG: methylenetetrahydrofolate--tRNA-(uracil(54)-C(5))-methyltransferase (FADH(2)-oxidizing) TrmFO [Acidobacteria bacterium 13_1_20CM_2_65_9]